MACGQFAGGPQELLPGGSVVRTASPDDVHWFGVEAAEEIGLVATAQALVAEFGDGGVVVDGWLCPDGARAFLHVEGDAERLGELAAALTQRLGLPVDLVQPDGAGFWSVVTGPSAGIPWDAATWLADELENSDGAEPKGVGSARGFIDRAFPLELRPAPRERRRTSREGPSGDVPSGAVG